MAWSAFSVSSAGGVTWEAVIIDTNMAAKKAYITNSAGLLSMTLPTSILVGEKVRIAGQGAGGWEIVQNASQLIQFGTSTTTTGGAGSLASTDANDCIDMVCITEDIEFEVISSIGSITVV